MNSIQGARRPLAGFGGIRARKLELHVPVALLDRGLEEPAKGMQQHRIERQCHALSLGRMQRDHRLAIAVMPGLDAGEKKRRLAEWAARLAGVVGLAEVGFCHRVLMLEAKKGLACLGVRLRADARARLLRELHEQRPQELDETPRE